MDCKVLPQWPAEHFTCSGTDPSDDCIKIVLKTSTAARAKSISWNNCIAKAQKLKIKEIKRVESSRTRLQIPGAFRGGTDPKSSAWFHSEPAWLDLDDMSSMCPKRPGPEESRVCAIINLLHVNKLFAYKWQLEKLLINGRTAE